MCYKNEKGIYLSLRPNIKNRYGENGNVITTYDPTSMLIDLKGSYDYFKTTECYNYIFEYFINKKSLYNFRITSIDVVINNIFTIISSSKYNFLFEKNFFKIYKDKYLKESGDCYVISNNLPKSINKIKLHITNNKYINTTYKRVIKIIEYRELLSLEPDVIYRLGDINIILKDKDHVSDFYKSISDMIPTLYATYQKVDVDSDIYKEILNRIDWDNHVYSYHEVHDVKDINIDKDKLDQLLRSFLNGFIEVKKKEYLDELVENYYVLKSKMLSWKDIILLKNIEKEKIIKYNNKDLTELYEYVSNNDNYCLIIRDHSGVKSNSIITYGIKVYMFDIKKLSNNEYNLHNYNLPIYRIFLKHCHDLLEISEVLDQVKNPDEFNASLAVQTYSNVSIKTSLIPEDSDYHWIYDEIYWRLSVPIKFLNIELCAFYKSMNDVLEVLREKLGTSTLFAIRKDLINNDDAFKKYKKYIKSLLDLYKSTREIGLYDIPDIIYYKDNERHRTNIDNLLSVIDKMKEGYKFEIDSIRLTDKYISLLKDKYFKDCVYKEFKDNIETIFKEKEK